MDSAENGTLRRESTEFAQSSEAASGIFCG